MTRLALLALFVLALAPNVRAGDPSFASCGTIVAGGGECPFFRADDGGLYVVAGVDLGVVGHRAFVTGTLDPNCITTCQKGDGCIVNASVASCVETCGFIDDGPFGLRFVADGAGRFVLDDFGGFAVGDRVYVVGADLSERCDPPNSPQNYRLHRTLLWFAGSRPLPPSSMSQYRCLLAV